MTRTWDLNADIGEGDEVMDAALLDIITSANVACGGHAGDAESMRRVCDLAAARGVAIGAQVSYVDREGFGRRRLDIPPAALAEQVAEQLGALDAHARAAGSRVTYVKPHGALYHAAVSDPRTAEAVLAGSSGLPMLTLPHGALRALSRERGVDVHAEAFADRGYAADGGLVPRDARGALLENVDEVTARVQRLVRDGAIVAVDGTVLRVDAASLCVHSDTPGADVIARTVRDVLVASGVVPAPFAGGA